MDTIYNRTVVDEISRYIKTDDSLKNYKVVSLNGTPKNEFYAYPWDV